MEIRGYGVIKVKAIPSATIDCVIDIVDAAKLARMPEDSELSIKLHGVKLRRQPVPNNCLHRMLLLSQVAIGGNQRL